MGMTIAIPRHFSHGDDLVLVRRKEYEALRRRATEYDEVASVIKQAEHDIRAGKVKYTKKTIAEAIKR